MNWVRVLVITVASCFSMMGVPSMAQAREQQSSAVDGLRHAQGQVLPAHATVEPRTHSTPTRPDIDAGLAAWQDAQAINVARVEPQIDDSVNPNAVSEPIAAAKTAPALTNTAVHKNAQADEPVAADGSIETDKPTWLVQVQQLKYQKPHEALAILAQYDNTYSSWSLQEQLWWLYENTDVNGLLGRFRQQQEFAERGLALMGEQQSELKGKFWYNLGFSYEMLGDFDSATEYYRKGMETAKQLEHEALQIEGMINQSAIMFEQDQAPEALEYLKKAFDRAQKIEDQQMLAETQAQLGLVYLALSFDESNQFLQEALRLFESMGQDLNSISVQLNLAVKHRFAGEYTEATQLLDQILKRALAINDDYMIYQTFIEFSVISTEQNQLDNALSYMQKAEQYLSAIQQRSVIADHHYQKAQLLQKLGQTSLALQEVNVLLQLLSDSKVAMDQYMVLYGQQLKASLLADAGEFEQAYQQMDDFLTGYLSLQDEKRDLAVQKLRLSFDNERQRARNESLSKDIELQRLRLQEIEYHRQQQWLLTGVLALATIVLFLIMLWQWRRLGRAKAVAAAATAAHATKQDFSDD
jgi:tetratricopeptide (TPR) repeat protein